MPRMSPLRYWSRQLVIAATTAFQLDRIERRRERRELARRGTPLVRVLFLHATLAHQARTFRSQVRWLTRHYDVIDFARFDELMANQIATRDKPAVLLTFDDGLASNYQVAAPILEDEGVRGLFFVIPGFSVLSGEAALAFYRQRIRERHPEPGMTPEQIADLARRGHTIGNHTFSHALLSESPAAEYEHEILDSAAAIESWIGRPVDTFAWPFVWNGVTPAAHRIATERHRYCFSPCAGRVDVTVDDPHLIWRTNIEPRYRHAEVRFQCSALADRFSAARREGLTRLLLSHAAPARRAA